MLRSLLKISIVVAVVWVSAPISNLAQAAEWGSLKGRLVVDGTPATLPPLAVDNKDPFCVTAKPVNEAIVVGKGNALANGVIYLRAATGEKVEVNPEYDAKLKEPIVLDNNGCSFHPHVTLVRLNQTLEIKNSDPTGHNTNITLFGFNQLIPANEKIQIKASQAGTLPQQVHCNIHSFMIGQILCLAHPYMAVSGADGSFEIKNMPAGKHEFQFWHEAGGYLKNLKLKDGATDKLHGRATLTIPAGQTLDLGDIKVPASALK